MAFSLFLDAAIRARSFRELWSMKWQEIPVLDSLSSDAKRGAIRLNALGSLFYFSKIVLGHSRLSDFHRYMCSRLERYTVRMVFEIPRDHFKTTIGSVSAPMWWSLPMTGKDEDLMLTLGYDDDWIKWMHRAHDPGTRTLIGSETIGNARKIGTKIGGHYESNALFRLLFPEILPKGTEKWNQDSMTHRRPHGVYHGEGTYDFIGVKGALQSRHYDRQVIDDPVGEKAINSDLVMDTTIDWVRKLPGAFDSDPARPGSLADQLFIGNCWSHRDLNYWLRKNVPYLEVESHSVDGGCCELHPTGTYIFPQEWNEQKASEIRQIEGNYNVQCQYRNRPVDPESVLFKSSWIRYYTQTEWKPEERALPTIANWQQLTADNRKAYDARRASEDDMAESQGATPNRLKMALHHETMAGETLEDIRAGDLDRVAILDPNHAGDRSRCRNAIVVLGMYNRHDQPRRIYLLDVWAKASSHEEWIAAAISDETGKRGLALKWRVHYLYIESQAAGQQGWYFVFKERLQAILNKNRNEIVPTVRPLKTSREANAKATRIRGMESIYENGFFWSRRRGQELFMEEYEKYPNGETIDILDLIGYSPQTWGAGSRAEALDFIYTEMQRRKKAVQTLSIAGY